METLDQEKKSNEKQSVFFIAEQLLKVIRKTQIRSEIKIGIILIRKEIIVFIKAKGM